MPYLRALRFALGQQANAYGFTLAVWGTGALAIWQLGKPDPAEVFAFIGGALISVSALFAASFGIMQTFREEEPARRAFSAMHLASVPGAVAAGWGWTFVVGGAGGFLLAGFFGVAVYEALLAAQIALGLA